MAASLLRVSCSLLATAAILVAPASADVYRWDTGEVIPGTEGITPGAGGWFAGAKLEFADLSRADLAGAIFGLATLSGADLGHADLTGASFFRATLTSTDLSDAVVTRTSFEETTSRGFTPEQLYSTASYKNRNLSGIGLAYNDLSGWNFAGQNLALGEFQSATLTGADLNDVVVTGASFADTTSRGFTREQFYSTASYRNKDLSRIGLALNDLAGWNFAGQNLTGAGFYRATLTSADLRGADLTSASFYRATLTGADLSDAVVTGASFEEAVSRGFTAEQLYATASYKNKDLSGINFDRNNLSGWNFAGQNLTGADFGEAMLTSADLSRADLTEVDFGDATLTSVNLSHADLARIDFRRVTLTNADLSHADLMRADFEGTILTGVNLSRANLTGADFDGATLTGADLTDAVVTRASFEQATGFTAEQLYSTASYKNKDLAGIGLRTYDLSEWNFAGHNLTGADFRFATLTGANLSQANLTGVDFHSATLTGADLSYANLAAVNLRSVMLSGANLNHADLAGVDFRSAILIDADLSRANLAGADLSEATLTRADLSEAVVKGTSFEETVGFTPEQLYSTASYKNKDLSGIRLWGNDLSGANFAGQNLAGARFFGANLTSADLSQANLTGADFEDATLSGANLSDAVVKGTMFHDTIGFTAEQLYSTASYRNKDLSGIRLWGNDLSGANFAGQNLAGAGFFDTDLTSADLRQALLTRTNFQGAKLTGANLSHTDLTETSFDGATLTNADLSHANLIGVQFGFGVTLAGADLSHANLAGVEFGRGVTLNGADLSYANLAGAFFDNATLEGVNMRHADLTGANLGFRTVLTGADLTDAVVTGANLGSTTRMGGFTAEQLYSTASYKNKDLSGIRLGSNDLSGWNLAGQNLAGANFDRATLTSTDLSQANLAGAGFQYATLTSPDLNQANLRGANFSGATLTNTDLSHGDLTEADFLEATLTSTNLSHANLTGADFRGATLTSTDLSHADLTGADLRGVRDVDLSSAITRNMIAPDGAMAGLNLRDGEAIWIRDVSPPTPIRVFDAMSVSAGGVLRLVFHRNSWSSTISFEHAIPVRLGGSLELSFPAYLEVATQVGRTLDIFDWSGVEPSSAFDVTSPYLWDLSKLYSTGEVRLTGTGGVGDFDGSRRVGQADLDLVLLNWGTDGAAPLNGWINDLPVGLVDQAELDRVLLHWGSVLPSASVPEPSSLAMCALAMLLVGIYDLRRRRWMTMEAATKRAWIVTTETRRHGQPVEMDANCKLTIEDFQLSICNSRPAATYLPTIRTTGPMRKYSSLQNVLCGLMILFAALPARDSDAAEYTPLFVSGSPANRIDVVVIGDGYTSEQLATEYRPHVDSLVDYMFGGPEGDPFRRYRNFFNVHEVALASNESGADAHRFDGPLRDTALGAAYYYDGLNGQQLDIRWGDADRVAAESVPRQVWDNTDIRVALVNETTFGGTGGPWATYAAGYPSAFEIAAHEIGHSFASLADEYFTAGTTYTSSEPQQPNVTTGTYKWDRWLGYVDPDHPELGPVDYYEGGRYHQLGIYRPTRTSRMYRVHEPWNAISREAIIDAIYRNVRPLDDWTASGEVLVNPQTLWVEPIDANVFAFEWFIDGEKVSGAAGEMLDVSGLRQSPGEHSVRVRVYDRVLDHAFTGDSLDRWRKDDPSLLEQHIEWNLRTTLAGDYNGDGSIEQADLDLVLLYWGQPTLPPGSGWVEDLPVGGVSQTHLDQVLLHWGRTSGTVTAATRIPEPGTAALVAVALGVLGCCGFRIFPALNRKWFLVLCHSKELGLVESAATS